MNVSFAPLDSDRIEVVLALMAEYYEELQLRFDNFTARGALNQLTTNPDLGRLWVFLGDGEAVGYVAVSFGFNLEAGGRDGMVDELFVKPGYRGLGIGTRAMRLVESRARAMELRALYLEARRDNRKGQRFYRKLGYELRDGYCLAQLGL